MHAELAPDVEARMRPLWAAVDEAIRTDVGVVIELAELARPFGESNGTAQSSARLASLRATAATQVRHEERSPRTTAPASGEDERAATPAQVRRGRPRLTPEEREERAAEKRERHRAYMASRTPEKIEEDRARRRELRAARTPEERERENANQRAAYARTVGKSALDFDELLAQGALE
jgi:hypothetical protein